MEDGNFSQNVGGKEASMNVEQRIYGSPNRAYSSAYHLPPFELCVEMSNKGNGGSRLQIYSHSDKVGPNYE
ncbi:MAG TPA: hypothetical protein DCL42_03825 [Deltaproteobacteria bacterium]|nr:MAG: hypothetical protein A2090_02125 [Deltaproteobacteria bacterium GWD2_42_10]HAG50447.1 hypothetical protein [Deltaproteobacteria bacterium]